MLTYALFPQIGIRFLQNRGNPEAFEPVPGTEESQAPTATPAAASAQGPAVYSVRVNGREFTVEVAEDGQLAGVAAASEAAKPGPQSAGEAVKAVLAGNIFKVNVAPGDQVEKGQPLLVVEAMKMETAVSAPSTGTVSEVGDPLVAIAS